MLEDFSIPDSLVERYQQDGAICLRGVFNQHWLRTVESGIEMNKKNPSQYSENLRAAGGPGYYFNDYCNWQHMQPLRDLVFNSPSAAIAGRLMGSKTAIFYHEHVLTKDPGTSKETPWHQDQPYYPVEGFQNCSIWMPVDEVPMNTTIQFVRGSHRWGRWFYPRKFATSKNYPIERENMYGKVYEDVPNIDRTEYDILQWEIQPGDCIVFHMLTLHGAPSNTSSIPRRVLSTRWLGDDAVVADRPWQVSPPILGGLKPGDSFQSPTFPLVWQAESSS